MELYNDHYRSDSASRYECRERLGEGTFGEVRRAVDRVSGAQVAIKYVRMMSRKSGIPRAVFREMESLKQLSSSPYIIKLHDVYPEESNLCLVMEYVVSDLSEVILQSTEYLTRCDLKSLYRMILEGLVYCHERNIIHRDIKPANYLLSASGCVKLGDFGLARVYDHNSGASMSHQVATRQYRAPELLFASRHYTPAVDIWSAAVVMAELATLQPLFPGNNDIDQMFRVFQVLGSPTPDVWPSVTELPDYSKVSFPNIPPLDLRLILPQVHVDEVAFIQSLLTLDPEKRLTAATAIRSSFFSTNPAPSNVLTFPIPIRKSAAIAGGGGGVNAQQRQGQTKGKKVATVQDFLDYVDSSIVSDVI
mmetsp:Transcript_348/g.479  ORF Transcript_348/g.479 Transcript_348/m.479 type:complete len:363 (+) Transcript_348:37-1125(+)